MQDNDAPAGAAPAQQPAPTGAASRLFAEAGSTTPVLPARPASGWQEVYDGTVADAAAAAAAGASTPEPAAAATPEAAAASGLPVDEEGRLPFFFLDAYETPDVPGEELQQHCCLSGGVRGLAGSGAVPCLPLALAAAGGPSCRRGRQWLPACTVLQWHVSASSMGQQQACAAALP